jgi:O-antigen/teichoic acid export membrane protein
VDVSTSDSNTIDPPSQKNAGEPPENNLKGKAVSGAFWTFGGFGLQKVIAFGSNLALAHWLGTELMGTVLFVFLLREALLMFTDIGIAQSLIQTKRTDLAFTRTAWTVQILRGLIIFTIVCSLAPVVVHVFGQTQYYWIVPLAALTALIDGFASTAMYTFNRRLKAKQISLLELVGQVIGAIVIVSWAYFDRSVMPVLVGGIVVSIYKVIASHWLNRETPDGIAFDKSAWTEMVTLGKWIMVSTIITFLASKADQFVMLRQMIADLGPLDAKALFGVYGQAMLIAMIPLSIVLRVGARVVFPTFSATVRQGGNLARAFFKARQFVVAGGGVCLLFFVIGGPAAVSFLYPDSYRNAGLYLSIIAVTIWFQTLDAANQAALLALKQNKWQAITNLIKFALMITLLPLGYHLYGVAGALVGVVIADLVKYLVSSVMNIRNGLPLLKTDLLAMAWYVPIALAGVWLLSGHELTHHTKLLALRDIAIAGAISCVAAGTLFVAFKKLR